MRQRARSAWMAAVVASLCLLTGITAPLPGAEGATAAGEPTADAPTASGLGRAEISVTSVAPAVATGTESVTLRGTLRNVGEGLLSQPRVSVVAGPATTTREDVRAWANDDAPATGAALGTTRLRGTVAPGQSAYWQIKVVRPATHLTPSFGTVPVSVQSGGRAVHTFIGAQRTKEYVPLGTTWVLPLTLDADPELFGPVGAERTAAWRKALGPQSRLSRLLDTTGGHEIVWAVDPTLLETPGEAKREGAEQSAERAVREAFRTRLRARLRENESLLLPQGDADVAAAATSTPVKSMVAPLVAASNVQAQGLTSRADVLWPADGVLSPERERALGTLPGVSALLVPDVAIVGSTLTPDAAQRTSAGTLVLASDTEISELAASGTGGGSRGERVQQFVAETAAVVHERSGSQRSLLIAGARGLDPNGTALRAVLATADTVPWLVREPLDVTLDRAASAAPARIEATTALAAQAVREAGLAVPPAALTSDGTERLDQARNAILPTVAIRSDGVELSQHTTESLTQLASVRWRGHDDRWAAQAAALEATAKQSRAAITVSTDDVNFFADSGRLQLTVRNTLPVAVQDLRVRLVPTNGRLSIDKQPEPLQIGPGSRQVVTVHATAHGPGLVPVTVTVTTAEGAQLATPESLRVKVAPTGNRIYWVVGAGAALLVAAGTWRSLRRGRRARTAG